MSLSRRGLLKAGAAAAAVTALDSSGLGSSSRAWAGTAGAPPTTVTITGSAFGTGSYNYHPFTMPVGVNRLDVRLTKTGTVPARNAIGLGIFDTRGAHYGTRANPNGFRGIFGEERSSFTIAPDFATNAFIPGSLPAGPWTLIVPVFTVGPEPLTYSIAVTMTYGDAPAAFVIGAEVDLVRDEPGWYRGDLHAHTQASSDALSSGSAMLPADWARTCKRIGLDFLALTDHNVISQNFALAHDAADTGVLLMAGEEMTNWFYGHATVSGISSTDWFDWRQLPGSLYAAQGTGDPNVGRIQDFLGHARDIGAFVSAAHPLGATLAWRFFPDAAVDPRARTDSLEVWTGLFQPDDAASVRTWDSMLQAGQRIVANGGSDLHGVNNNGGSFAGTPTTVVHAPALGKRQVIEALRRGRSFITRVPTGAEAYLSVTSAVGNQRQIMGGTVYGAATDLTTVTVDCRRAAGLTLQILRDGAVVSTTVLTDPDQSVSVPTPIGPTGGYVRAELHGQPFINQNNQVFGSYLDMEALTNPVWLAVGPVPDGTVRDDTMPPPPDGTSAPALPEAEEALLLPLAGAAAGAAVIAARRRRSRPRQMTHSEFRIRAASPGWADPVRLTGEVTSVEDGRPILSRWVPGCCSQHGQIEVVLLSPPDGLEVGQWWEVAGVAEPGADIGSLVFREQPLVLRAGQGRQLDTPLPRDES